MWDNRQKVGVLSDFDLARFANQTGASGRDNTGTLPFMALDLLSEEGLRGEILRRYRHEAESFAWSLVCLCLATVENKEGKNYTKHPHPLQKWFTDWRNSREAKLAFQWHEHDNPDIPLVYPDAKILASALHKYWVDRYNRQFPHPYKDDDLPHQDDLTSLIGGTSDIANSTTEHPHYEEAEDDGVFLELLLKHGKALRIARLEGVRDCLVEMTSKYKEVDWDA
jgi:hypothetical protein